METLVELLGKALVLLFLIGVAGCLLVIPRTAFELIQTLLEPDTDDEIAGHKVQPAPQA
jgi:hypothetical protein